MSEYATVAELKAEINKTGSGDDTSLQRILDAAERNINRACNRPDGFVADSSASARIYTGLGLPWLYIDECISVTLVSVKESVTSDDYTDWATTDWISCSGDPQAPDFNSLPYDLLLVDPTGDESIFTGGRYTTRGGFRPLTQVSRGAPTVRVTGRWGYATTVPPDIKECAIMQSARWFKRLQGAMSDVLASGELGTLLYRQSLDPDIKRILVDGRYIRPMVGRR